MLTPPPISLKGRVSFETSHLSRGSSRRDGAHYVPDKRLPSFQGFYEVQGESAALAAALALEKPKLFSKQMVRLYFVCIVAYLSMPQITRLTLFRFLYQRF